LEMARCYKRLKELEKKNRSGRLLDCELKDLRDKIGKRLGVSGRTLDRYLRVLNTPQEVQDAVTANKLAVTVAGKVAGLRKVEQEQIAREIREGGDPGKVIKRVLGEAAPRVKNIHDEKDALLRAMKRGVAVLNGKVTQLRWVTDNDVTVLRDCQELIEKLL